MAIVQNVEDFLSRPLLPKCTLPVWAFPLCIVNFQALLSLNIISNLAKRTKPLQLLKKKHTWSNETNLLLSYLQHWSMISQLLFRANKNFNVSFVDLVKNSILLLLNIRKSTKQYNTVFFSVYCWGTILHKLGPRHC